MDRMYELTVRTTLVLAGLLALVTIVTAVSLGIPQLGLWVALAAATGFYAKKQLGRQESRMHKTALSAGSGAIDADYERSSAISS